MKKILIYSTAIVALTSCLKTEFDPRERTSGSADFTNYVAVGNSLTQGYQDGGLHNELSQQENSFPALIAQQMAKVEPKMGTFEQPLVTGDGAGYKKLDALDPVAGPTIVDVAPDNSWSSWGNKSIKYNNLGIAGVRLIDCVGRDLGEKFVNHAILGGSAIIPGWNGQTNEPVNPYARFLDFGGEPPFGTPVQYVDHIRNSKATFFTCWLGNNDVLGWATSGGVTDVTNLSIPGLGTIKIVKSELTPQAEFQEKYDSVLTAFKQIGAKGVVATLPDVTSIPFFTTVPYNPIPLTQTDADTLNSNYSAYNAGLQLAVSGNLITQAEADKRKITFHAGEDNAIVIEDEGLTDLTGLGLPSIRQATANDLILLTAASEIGRELVAGDPTTKYGITVPFNDTLVLIKEEIDTVRNHTMALNGIIKNLASKYGFGVVDMYTFLGTLKSGYTFNGVDFDASYISGGSFSLDGVHPNTKGYAIVANEFIRVINETYGSTIPPVDVNAYNGIIFP